MNSTVRLIGGPDDASGIVEVYFNGQWGTVCDDNWDINDARLLVVNLATAKLLQRINVHVLVKEAAQSGWMMFNVLALRAA